MKARSASDHRRQSRMTWVLLVTLAAISAAQVSSRGFKKLDLGFPKFPSLVYYDYMMDEPEDYDEYETTSYCQCKEVCIAKNCSTVSMMKVNRQGVSCKVSTKLVQDMKLRKSKKGVTYSSYDKAFFLGEDGMFYKMFAIAYNVIEGRTHCTNAFPVNGRLPITKTVKQFQSLLQYRVSIGYHHHGHAFMLNLRNENGKVTWGDGTLYEDSEISRTQPIDRKDNMRDYEAITLHKVQKITVTPHRRWIICQLNPMDDE